MDNNTSDSNQTIAPEATGQVGDLLSVEKLILSYIIHIDRAQDELKKLNEMLDNILINDPTYKENLDKAKEAARIKLATKQEILKQSEPASLNSKITDLRTQIKELRTSLSNHLQEYQKLSGSNQIESDDGEVREIVYMAKLIKRNAFRP